jgi:hypothetical protein
MGRINLLITFLALFCFIAFSASSMGANTPRKWLISIPCNSFKLTVWDKLSDKQYLAKYVVTSSDGEVFVAERNATDHNSAMVVFPDDFQEQQKKIRAWMSCVQMSYKWSVYADNVLVDQGLVSYAVEGVKRK